MPVEQGPDEDNAHPVEAFDQGDLRVGKGHLEPHHREQEVTQPAAVPKHGDDQGRFTLPVGNRPEYVHPVGDPGPREPGEACLDLG